VRFIVVPYPYDRLDAESLGDIAAAAERLNFEAVGFSDHLLPPRGAAAVLGGESWWDPLMAASWIASRTTRLKVALSILLLPLYDPIRLAKQVTTLDVLSGGRVLCGVGSGWYQDEFDRLGRTFTRRFDDADEHLAVIRELWTSAEPSFSGSRISFSDVSFEPKPVRPAGVPLFIGGSGPRALARAARYGDCWYPMTGTPDELARGFATVKELAAGIGRDPGEIALGFSNYAVGLDPASQLIRAESGATVGSERTAAQVVDEIGAYADAGVDWMTVWFAWRTPQDLIEAMTAFTTDIARHFLQPALPTEEHPTWTP